MRDLVIEQILHTVQCNGGGTPTSVPVNVATSNRWRSLHEKYCEYTGIVIPKKLRVAYITEDGLRSLSDFELIELLMIATRRSMVQM